MKNYRKLMRTKVPRKVSISYIIITILFLILPILFGSFLATEVVVFALFALGYNIILGYGGEMSFGHATMFGTGAYGTLFATQYVSNLYTSIIIGVLISTIIGFFFHLISLRRRGIYFSMITLALGMMFYLGSLQYNNISGGFGGITIGNTDSTVNIFSPGNPGAKMYLLYLLFLLVILLLTYRIINSPYGYVLKAVNEEENRAAALGYDTNRILILGGIISSFIAGFAGSLYAILYARVDPNIFFWSMSAEVILITIIGGVGTLGGPILGAIVYRILRDQLSEIINVWEIAFGIIIILVVSFAPRGIYGYYLDESIKNSGVVTTIGKFVNERRTDDKNQ